MAHVGCRRHEKHYARWEWMGRAGINILDAGRTSNNAVIDSVRIPKSAAAPCSIFPWLTVEGEKCECGVFDCPLIIESIPSSTKISGPSSTSNTVKATKELLFLESCFDQSASIAPTRSIFAWLTVGGEGWGESERSIYEHPWMKGLVPSDTDESASDGSSEADEHTNWKSTWLSKSYVTSGNGFKTICDNSYLSIVKLCQHPSTIILSLHPDVPWFHSAWPASNVIFTHLADHGWSVLLTKFPLHITILGSTGIEIMLIILMKADTTCALHSWAGRHCLSETTAKTLD